MKRPSPWVPLPSRSSGRSTCRRQSGSISVITILAYTAIAGAVGAGGLGDLAIRYGYNRRVASMLLVTIVILVLLVQIIQSVFSRLSTSIDKRLK